MYAIRLIGLQVKLLKRAALQLGLAVAAAVARPHNTFWPGRRIAATDSRWSVIVNKLLV